MWKSLGKLSWTAFLFLLIWTGVEYSDSQTPLVSWEAVVSNQDVPTNRQVQLPKGHGLHPLAVVREDKSGKLEIYQYIYVPENQLATWQSALDAYKKGDQAPIVELAKKSSHIVIVDTSRYKGQAKDATPTESIKETAVIGYCHRGFNYLRAHQQEWKGLFGHLESEKFIVLVENPEQQPKKGFPMAPAAGALAALLLGIGCIVMGNKS